MRAGVNETRNAVAALRRFIRKPVAEAEAREKCELCRAPLAADHRHLLETATGKTLCACDPCAWRFPSSLEGRFKLIPREVRTLPGFCLSDADWESLAFPIHLVFILTRSSDRKAHALYPSPAGVTEAHLPASAWEGLLSANPPVAQMAMDVEALLINRLGGRRDQFLAPIDQCYQLAGLIRLRWHGLSGGEELWEQVGSFFENLAKDRHA